MASEHSFALSTAFENEDTLSALKTALSAGRLSHAVLLFSPEGCGRGHISRLLAADFLFGPQTNSTKNEKHAAAIQSVLENRSSEVIVLEGQGASGQISVESVRYARNEIFHSSLSSQGRVVLIPEAQKMTIAAANALLKVLEEPPPHALFILSAPSPAALPATIASRCSLYSLAPLSAARCKSELEKAIISEELACTQQDIELLCSLFGGCFGLCLKTAREPMRMQAIHDVFNFCTALGKADNYTLLKILTTYEGRGDDARKQRLEFLLNLNSLLSAVLLAPPQSSPVALNPATAAAAAPFVSTAYNQLRQNAAPKICLTALAVNLSRIPLQ